VPIKAMFRYGVENDLIPHPVKFGTDLVSPSADQLRENRTKLEKGFSVEEVRRLVGAAMREADAGRPQPLAWILLGLNAGFHNIDFSSFGRHHVATVPIGSGEVAEVSLGRLKKGLSARRAVAWQQTLAALE